MKRFIESRCVSLEVSNPCQTSKPLKSPKSHKGQRLHGHHASSDKSPCCVCKASHRVYSCPKFQSFDYDKKQEVVRSGKLCRNCLGSGHIAESCPSSNVCRVSDCGKRHHTLLHRYPVPSAPPPPNSESNSLQIRSANSRVVLATALVPVFNSCNEIVMCRALFDSGSDSSFISESCAQRLGVHRRKHSLSIYGIGGQRTSQGSEILDLKFGSDSGISASCVVQKRLTRCLPVSFFPISKWQSVHSLKLADPKFNIPAPIDLLLGADVYDEIVLSNKFFENSLCLRETVFRWIVSGHIGDSKALASLRSFHVASEQFDLSRFWETEEVPDIPKLSLEEIKVENNKVLNMIGEKE